MWAWLLLSCCIFSVLPPAVLQEHPASLMRLCLQAGNAEDVAKYAKRTVRVTQQHNDECKRLLELMGVPIINVSFPLHALRCTCPGLEVLAASLAHVSHAQKDW